MHYGSLSRLSIFCLTTLFFLSSIFELTLLAQSSTIVTNEAQFIDLSPSYEIESYEGSTLPMDFTIELAEDRVPGTNDFVWTAPDAPAEGSGCVQDGEQVLLWTNKVKITFDAPLSAFATYLIDLGDYGGSSLELKTSTGETWTVTPTAEPGCGKIFTGIVASEPFTWITLEIFPQGNRDGVYIDRTFYTFAPPAPVPTMSQWGLFLFSLVILNLGVVFIWNYNRREAIA